jgi:hypothetical protein
MWSDAKMSPSTFLPAKALVFDLCEPRPDVLQGVSDADFAADLAKVLSREASPEYRETGRFFSNTYPTRGLRNLLENVCACLSGARPAAASIFRLDTTYGGGKTHALIALAHAANGMQGVSNVEEFVARELLPTGNLRVAAYVAVLRGAYDAQIFTNDREKLGAALGHDVSHTSAHASEMKPEQKQEQAVTPQREIAPKQEQSFDFGLGL